MKYRIVRDNLRRYSVQVRVRVWWFSFWVTPDDNTHTTYDEATAYMACKKQAVLRSRAEA